MSNQFDDKIKHNVGPGLTVDETIILNVTLTVELRCSFESSENDSEDVHPLPRNFL